MLRRSGPTALAVRRRRRPSARPTPPARRRLCERAAAAERRTERSVNRLARGYEGSDSAFVEELAPVYARYGRRIQKLLDDLRPLADASKDPTAHNATVAAFAQIPGQADLFAEAGRKGRPRDTRVSELVIEDALKKARKAGIPACAQIGQPARSA